MVVVSVLGEREGVSPASSTSVSKPHKTHSKNKKKKSGVSPSHTGLQ